MPSENNPLKILLVEDDPVVSLVHRYMLEDMGYSPDIAKNGKEALTLSTGDYDLILMDIGLPDIDGIQVTVKIRDREINESKNRSHIIAMTAYSIEEVRDKCFAAGMDEVTAKPIEYDTLQKYIIKFCGASKSPCHHHKLNHAIII
jgi:CheY-like chemotaxis protein